MGLAFGLFEFFKFRTEHQVCCQTVREAAGLGRKGLREASPANQKPRLTQRARRNNFGVHGHSFTQAPSLSSPTEKSDISNSPKPGLTNGLTLSTCLPSSVSLYSPTPLHPAQLASLPALSPGSTSLKTHSLIYLPLHPNIKGSKGFS